MCNVCQTIYSPKECCDCGYDNTPAFNAICLKILDHITKHSSKEFVVEKFAFNNTLNDYTISICVWVKIAGDYTVLYKLHNSFKNFTDTVVPKHFSFESEMKSNGDEYTRFTKFDFTGVFSSLFKVQMMYDDFLASYLENRYT